jgi:type I restriction enzyme S subunit
MAQFSIVKKSELEGAMRLDAEYYMPGYLKASKQLRECGAVPLGELLSDVRYGIYTEPDYLEQGTDFIRALNLEELAIKGDVLKVKPSAVPNEKYLLRSGDVLIVRSGANVGNSGIVVDKFVGATFGSYTIRLRFKPSINPYVCYIFLKSKFGRLQTVRFRTGLAQPNINIPNLKQLQIFSHFPMTAQQDIENLVKQSHQEVFRSASLYVLAEQLLLDAVSFKALDLSRQLYYTVPYKKAMEVRRLDAEHFQPKYERLIQHLAKMGRSIKLQDMLEEPVQKGITPEYDPIGNIVVVNSQHLGRYCLNIEATDRTTEVFWQQNKKAQVKPRDVMVYATGAYIGRTNIWLMDSKAVAGVDILLVRPSEACNPYYLSVYLNSPLGVLQAEKFASGSGQRHIYPDNISQFVVHLPPKKSQERIAGLVTQSWKARQKGRQLLEEARHKVEAIIEGKSM